MLSVSRAGQGSVIVISMFFFWFATSISLFAATALHEARGNVSKAIESVLAGGSDFGTQQTKGKRKVCCCVHTHSVKRLKCCAQLSPHLPD